MTTAAGERRTAPRILAVTGGKGGVGKSNLVLNLAVSLARWGRRVLLIDGDLGLANLDVLLGLTPAFTIEHLASGEAGLDDVLLDGPAGVRLLPAASGVPRFTKLDEETRRCVMSTLADGTADVDDVLIDTGAGLGDASLSLQLAASRVLLVTTPEPTSLVDAYASLKVLRSADPEKPVGLVVNEACDDREANRVHDQLTRAAEHFLDCRPALVGTVYSDPRVAESVRRQRAVVDLFPDCRAARCYERIALQLTRDDAGDELSAPYWERLLMPVHEEMSH